jgi:hypothetical protein
MLKCNLVAHTSQVIMISLETMHHHEEVDSFSFILVIFQEFRLYSARLLNCFQHFLTLSDCIDFFEHDRLY